jgi:hypothetical protein
MTGNPLNDGHARSFPDGSVAVSGRVAEIADMRKSMRNSMRGVARLTLAIMVAAANRADAQAQGPRVWRSRSERQRANDRLQAAGVRNARRSAVNSAKSFAEFCGCPEPETGLREVVQLRRRYGVLSACHRADPAIVDRYRANLCSLT